MKFISFVKQKDFLGENVNFSINESSSFKTVLGGFLSIILILCYFCFFFLFGIDFLFKKNPNTYSEIRVPNNLSNFPSLDFNHADFLFGIKAQKVITGEQINVKDLFYPDIFYLENFFNKTSGEYEEKQTYIGLIACDQLNTTDLITGIYNLSQWICPNITRLKGKLLKGDWTQQLHSSLQFSLNICPYNKEIGECKNFSKILELFNAGDVIIDMIIPEVNIDTDDYENPFSINLKNHYNFLDTATSKNDYLYLMGHLLEDDIGVFFETKNQTRKYGAFSIEYKDSIRENRITNDYLKVVNSPNYYQNSFYNFNVLFHKNTYYYSRKYMKFQELIANVNGFMDLLIFIIGFLYKFHNQFRLDLYIFKKSFFINDQNKSEKKNISIELNRNISNLQIREDLKSNKLTKKKNECQGIADKSSSRSFNELKNIKFISFFDLNENEKHAENRIENRFNTIQNSKNSSVVHDIDCINKKHMENIINIDKIQEENKKNRNDFYQKNNENIYTKFKIDENSGNFSFYEFCMSLFCKIKSKNIEYRKYKKLEEFSEKIYSKFDIFYYLKMINKNKFIRKVFLDDRFSFKESRKKDHH